MTSLPPEPKALLRGHRAAVSALCFLYGESKVLASGDVDGDVLLWSVSTKRVLQPLLETHPGGVLSISASSYDKRWISQGRTDGSIKIWQEFGLVDVVRTDSESFCRAGILWGTALDDIFLACTTRDDAVIALWKVNDSANKRFLKPPQDTKWGMVMDVTLRKANEALFVIGVYEDGALRVFSGDNEAQPAPLISIEVQGSMQPATSFVLGNLDAHAVARGIAGGSSAELCSFVLDFAKREATATGFVPAYEKSGLNKKSQENDEETRLGKGVSQLALRPDGRICAIASWDHRVRVLHFRTCKHLAVLKHHRSSVQAVCFSSDSLLLASGSKDQSIAIWSIYNEQ